MKKTAYILATAALIAALSGCNSNGSAETTTESTSSKGGSVTQITYQEEQPKEDTTDEALAFLREQVPLFTRYMEKRMQYPLTFETEIESNGSTAKTAMYIKDETTACYTSTDSSGNTSCNLFIGDMLYIIESKDRMIYTNPTTEEIVKENISKSLLSINADDARSLSYVSDYDSFNDVLYKHEIIYNTNGIGTHYFFDENTEELVYIVSGETTTKITQLKNEVDESVFELPADYDTMDLNEYYAQRAANNAANSEADHDHDHDHD